LNVTKLKRPAHFAPGLSNMQQEQTEYKTLICIQCQAF